MVTAPSVLNRFSLLTCHIEGMDMRHLGKLSGHSMGPRPTFAIHVSDLDETFFIVFAVTENPENSIFIEKYSFLAKLCQI